MDEKASISEEEVYNYAYDAVLRKDEVQGYLITRKEEQYGIVLLRNDVGNTSDLNGIKGVYGLGQTMACAFHKKPEYMTVLRW